MNISNYIRKSINQRRIHLLELLIIKDQIKDKMARKKLERKIQYEREQLSKIDNTWVTPS